MQTAPEGVAAVEVEDRPAPIVDIPDVVAGLSVSTPQVQAQLVAVLEAMEMDSMDEFWTLADAAERVEQLAVEVGRPDLRMRARLVRAEALVRQGDTTAS